MNQEPTIYPDELDEFTEFLLSEIEQLPYKTPECKSRLIVTPPLINHTMKKSKFLPVYRLTDTGNRRTNLSHLQGKAGVYLIKEAGKIVYIGHSTSDLYKTALRHFQSWDDPTQQRITYAGQPVEIYTIRIVQTTPKQAPALEKKLILRHNPRDNWQKYESYQLTPYDDQVLETYDNTETAPF